MTLFASPYINDCSDKGCSGWRWRDREIQRDRERERDIERETEIEDVERGITFITVCIRIDFSFEKMYS